MEEKEKKRDIQKDTLNPVTKVNTKLDKELQEWEVDSTTSGWERSSILNLLLLCVLWLNLCKLSFVKQSFMLFLIINKYKIIKSFEALNQLSCIVSRTRSAMFQFYLKELTI